MTAIGIAIVILYLLLGGDGGDTIIQQCALPVDAACQANQNHDHPEADPDQKGEQLTNPK